MAKKPTDELTATGWDNPEIRRRIIAAGFIGGAASALIKPLREVATFTDLFNGNHNPALVGAVVMGILGCVAVWMFKESDIKKALSMSLGLPALLVNLGATISQPQSTPPTPAPSVPTVIERIEAPASPGSNAVGWFSIFAPSAAYAQEAVPAYSTPANLSVEINTDIPIAYEVAVLDSSLSEVSSFSVSREKSSFIAKALPIQTAFLRFKVSGLVSENYPVNLKAGDSTVQVDLHLKTTRQVGFAQVFGKAAEDISTLSIGVSARPKPSVGQSAWIFLGTWTGSTWKTKYVSTPSSGMPALGQEGAVTFPLNMRAEAAQLATPRLGVISAGQKVRIDEIRPVQGPGPAWAKVTVMTDNAPAQ